MLGVGEAAGDPVGGVGAGEPLGDVEVGTGGSGASVGAHPVTTSITTAAIPNVRTEDRSVRIPSIWRAARRPRDMRKARESMPCTRVHPVQGVDSREAG